MKTEYNNGYSLVEVIVSLAIISMLIIVLLSFVTTSLNLIVNEGEDTNKLFSAQEELDKYLADSNYTIPNEAPFKLISNTNYFLNEIQGTLVKIVDKNNNKVLLYTFVPTRED